jgi:uncharacterized protein YndB with AHSA1/START domain
MDVRVGGRRHVATEVVTPTGRRWMWFAGEFVDVEANQRLVYNEYISDERATALGADGLDGHTNATEVRVELAEHDGRTSLVLTHVGIDLFGPRTYAVPMDRRIRGNDW